MYAVDQAIMSPEPNQPASSHQNEPSSDGAIGAEHLRRALAQGPAGLPEQIRYLFALSQVRGMVAAHSPKRATMSLREARLRLLDQLSPYWSDSHLDALITDTEKIKNPNQRLPLLALYYSQIETLTSRREIQHLVQQIQQLDDPAARAEGLFNSLPLLAQADTLPIQSEAMLHLLDTAKGMKNTEARLRSLIALLAHLPEEVVNTTSQSILDTLQATKNDSLCSKSLAALSPNLPLFLFAAALKVAASINSETERIRALIALAPRFAMNISYQQQLCDMAISAIEAIETEDERADLLINFAPYLVDYADGHDFPVTLKRALALAMAFTRERLRAHALVALAPHLPSELRGETLAAVHSLGNEQERALLLAQLAPTLPSDMVVASLAVAHSMRERDSRVLALSTLAHYVPPHAYHQTIMDALAAAAYMPSLFERVQVLVDLLPLLSPKQKAQAIDNALNAIRQLRNANARARAIRLLAPHLDEPLVAEVYAISRAIDPFQQRFDALLGLLPVLPEPLQTEALRDMFAGVQQLPLAYQRGRALMSLMPHLDAAFLEEAETLIDQLDDPVDQVLTYVTMVQYLPPDKRKPIIRKAWRRMVHIEGGYDRASTITAIAPFLPNEAQGSLSERIMRTINLVTDEYDQASTIILLAPLVASQSSELLVKLPEHDALLLEALRQVLTIPDPEQRHRLLERGIHLWLSPHHTPERAFTLWQGLVLPLSTLPLTDVLLCLVALQPLMKTFATSSALKNIAQLLGLR